MADIINGKAITAMKVAELQQELQRRGMNRNGRKSELVERLRKVSCFARVAVSPRAHACALACALFCAVQSIEGKEDTVDQALSGEDTVHTSKEEASPISADDAMIGTDEALLSTEEALATTEEEIHPDSTCTMEIASECMQPQVCMCVCVCTVSVAHILLQTPLASLLCCAFTAGIQQHWGGWAKGRE